MDLKAGTRLVSKCCDAEVMIIKSPGQGNVSCGGHEMYLVSEKGSSTEDLNADLSGGVLIGKRYTDADQTIELLCVKAGKGTLAFNGIIMRVKEAKKLPSSD